MPDTTTTSADNIYAWLNNDALGDSGNYFRVQKQTGATEVFRVDQVGNVHVFGTLRRSGTHELMNDRAGSGAIARFMKAGQDQGSIGYRNASSGNQAYFYAVGPLAIRSAGDIIFHLDSDGDATEEFQVRDYADNLVLQVTENGAFRLCDAGAPEITLEDGVLHVGADEQRGIVQVLRDATAGSEKAGLLVLEDAAGQAYYLWVDSSNRLRMHNANPGSNDLLGDVVGSQT
ncbi:MAG: hypothetical protein FJ102_17775 [Deltaproteobacteria bacterium]|nr:hypothetical protein [Deltaproteobacteria bacterium]